MAMQDSDSVGGHYWPDYDLLEATEGLRAHKVANLLLPIHHKLVVADESRIMRVT